MIDKIRISIKRMFEDTNSEKLASVKFKPIVLWAAVSGVVGGIAPFVVHTGHPLAVSLAVSLAVMAITFRFVVKKVVPASQNEADSR